MNTSTTLEDTLKPFIDPRWSFGVTVYCPSGWEQIVLDAHAKLVELNPDYKILQIKEKFGGLRYYTQGFPEDQWDEYREIVTEAENRALETCEQCGTQENGVSLGTLAEGYYWLFTLCDPCRASRLAKQQARDAELYGDDDDS